MDEPRIVHKTKNDESEQALAYKSIFLNYVTHLQSYIGKHRSLPSIASNQKLFIKTG